MGKSHLRWQVRTSLHPNSLDYLQNHQHRYHAIDSAHWGMHLRNPLDEPTTHRLGLTTHPNEITETQPELMTQPDEQRGVDATYGGEINES